MQNITTSGQIGQSTGNNYSASVPISVYREATAELQATQIKLESLKVHNEQLIQQNQKLRREIEKVVNSAMQLQEAVNEAQLATHVAHSPQVPSFHNSQTGVDLTASNSYSYWNSASEPDSPESTSHSATSSPSLPFTEPRPTDSDFPEHLFTEEPDENRYSQFSSAQVSELNGIWLVVAICLIVMIAAFGAGYWVVRPILQQRSR